MSVWSVIYASLGGASRSVLASGVEIDVLMTGMYAKPKNLVLLRADPAIAFLFTKERVFLLLHKRE